jgi:hypothetical protein
MSKLGYITAMPGCAGVIVNIAIIVSPSVQGKIVGGKINYHSAPLFFRKSEAHHFLF